MATSWCRLTRQDDGAILMLDGVVGFRVVDDVAVTELPVEGGADVADNIVPRARMVMLDVEVSNLPTTTDIIVSGDFRLEQVLAFLADSVGRLLTLTTTDRPTYRNLLLTSRGSPTHSPTTRSSRLSITARETLVVYADVTTATGGGPPLGRVAAAGAASASRGDVGAAPVRDGVLITLFLRTFSALGGL